MPNSYNNRNGGKRKGRHISRKTRHINIILTLISSIIILYMLLVVFAPDLYHKMTRPILDWLALTTSAKDIKGEVKGIDVSRYQGGIHWEDVASDGVKFAYIKATEGRDIVDDRYAENIKGAQDAGLAVGSYHYLTSRSPVKSQFANFTSTIDKEDQDLLPMVDIEKAGVSTWNARQIKDSLQLFLDLSKKHFGKYPIIYTYSNFFNQYLSPDFNHYYLFIANYQQEPVVKGAGVHNIWQLTDRGRVSGINHRVDLDILSNGTTLEDLKL